MWVRWRVVVGGTGTGETRYARPCRPVNPLLMIWLVRHRSVAHRAHRRYDVCPLRYGGEVLLAGEDEVGLLLLEVVEVEERLRRKGIEGRR